MPESDRRRCVELGGQTPRGTGKHGPASRIRTSALLATYGHAARKKHARRALELGPGALEDLVSINADLWRGRRVFVTGHTGFKGGWLTLWLHHLAASVHGFALDPPTMPSLFETARIKSLLASDTRADLADL